MRPGFLGKCGADFLGTGCPMSLGNFEPISSGNEIRLPWGMWSDFLGKLDMILYCFLYTYIIIFKVILTYVNQFGSAQTIKKNGTFAKKLGTWEFREIIIFKKKPDIQKIRNHNQIP